MEAMINYVLEFGQLTAKQIELIANKAKKINLKKGTYFSEAGNVSDRLDLF